MPPLPDAPGVVKVALSGTIGSAEVWLTQFFMHYSGTAPTDAQLATYNATAETAYSTNLKALIRNDCILTQVESIDLTSPTSATATNGYSLAGTRGTAFFPTQAAFVVSYEIGRRYRGGHPRGYWPFGIESDAAGSNQWGSTLIGSVTSSLPAFFASMTGGGWTGAGTITQVNVSFYSGFTVVTNPITGRARNVPTLRVSPTVDTVTSLIPRASIGTQRRRAGFID